MRGGSSHAVPNFTSHIMSNTPQWWATINKLKMQNWIVPLKTSQIFFISDTHFSMIQNSDFLHGYWSVFFSSKYTLPYIFTFHGCILNLKILNFIVFETYIPITLGQSISCEISQSASPKLYLQFSEPLKLYY